MSTAAKVATRIAKPVAEKVISAKLSCSLKTLDWIFRPIAGESPAKFEFSNSLPLSQRWHVAAGVVTYIVVIFSVQHFMRSQERITLKPLVFLHNILVCLFSAVLFMGICQEIWPLVWSLSLHDLLCSPKMYSNTLQYLYYLNFLGKYYELVDTIFIVLAKRKLIFLHWFHHSMTLLLTFVELEGYASVQWVPIVLNLLVHVVMYLYYALSVYKKNIPWKMAVTSLQITQFVLDLFAVYYATYVLTAQRYFSFLPKLGPCHGTPLAALFGCGLLTTYLFLFINFFVQTYKPKKGSNKGEPKSPKRVAAPSPAKKLPTRRATADSTEEAAASVIPRTPSRRSKTASTSKPTPKSTPKSTPKASKKEKSEETPSRYSLRNRS